VFEQVVPAALDDVFHFYEDAGNLPLLLREWRRLRMLRHEPVVQRGSVMWVEELFFGLPVAMGFRISVHERPFRIGGEQCHGPFSRFTHLHEFAACGGGTRVYDRLDLEVPWQYGGRWTLVRLIVPLLRRAFACRQRQLLHLAREGSLTRR
jgi:ligand-binding SRPBCC domain-containing protein